MYTYNRSLVLSFTCRPLNEEEVKSKQPLALCCDTVRSEVRISNAAKHLSRTFTFDRVYSSHASQEDVYENTMTSIIEEVLQGFNCTVFAYGQTGSGKTYTMEAGRHSSGRAAWRGQDRGIIPRAIEHIFQHLASINSEYTVRVSQLELYNEELFDLLSPVPPGCGDEPPLRIFDEVGLSGTRTTRVNNLEEVVVKSAADIFKILETSNNRRRVAETKMNKFSSRSHCIFSIIIHVKERNCEGEDMLKVGKLNLVDLAGSENIGRSGAVDDRRREAGLINQSLLTLGRVINALVDHQSHVPYRESKLTRLLQESLGGTAKTCVIATVSPAASNLEESLSTLDYAARAKNIKNKPQLNQKFTKSALIKEYVEELEALKAELHAARSKAGAVYLPQERYDSMITELESQGNRVVELESAITEKSNALDRLRTNFDRQLAEINDLSSSLHSTRTQLSSANEQLSQTTSNLEQVSRSLDEERLVLEEHQVVHEVLHQQANELAGTIDTTMHDIAGLHAKIGRFFAASFMLLFSSVGPRSDRRLSTFSLSLNISLSSLVSL
jgi:kinesin family member 11